MRQCTLATDGSVLLLRLLAVWHFVQRQCKQVHQQQQQQQATCISLKTAAGKTMEQLLPIRRRHRAAARADADAVDATLLLLLSLESPSSSSSSIRAFVCIDGSIQQQQRRQEQCRDAGDAGHEKRLSFSASRRGRGELLLRLASAEASPMSLPFLSSTNTLEDRGK